jgi:DNA-damage-inducible protein J
MSANLEVGTRTDAQANKEAELRFDLLTPNAETVEAMTAARLGDLVNVGSVENLLTDLRSDN